MLIDRADPCATKGWSFGRWNADLDVSIGYANAGIDEPHVHERITEIYLVARGNASVRVEQVTVLLAAGDVLVVQPGEAHTFLSSSPDYFHFVLHSPGVPGDKSLVGPDRLGL